ncbi:MAG: virulence protein RhuM/Fic/DOC family protein [Bacteroidales bacterium]|nr:virulence protein RhuM/Fic/DOC family protein [Candidatus Cryptobacteroides onthequi]
MNTNTQGRGEIVLYQTADGRTSIDVKLENETVWLTQVQMATIFDCSSDNIGQHLKNIYKEQELTKLSTTEIFSVVRMEGGRTICRKITHYNLDAILSVGYRVSSKRAVSFRQWANSVLKDYLIKGYAVRNDLAQQKYDDLKQLVEVMGRAMNYLEAPDSPAGEQIKSIFDVVKDYTYALDTLDSYDFQTLSIKSTTKEQFHATYENAMAVIMELKTKFGESDLFGHEKDGSFHSSIGQIYQTWDGIDLYPSVEEKAAMLLYLVVKNHSFSDGNKRIAATMFLWFMENNRILYGSDGHKRIADNALVALTLMIAESKTDEMDMMVKVVVNLINGDNK